MQITSCFTHGTRSTVFVVRYRKNFLICILDLH